MAIPDHALTKNSRAPAGERSANAAVIGSRLRSTDELVDARLVARIEELAREAELDEGYTVPTSAAKACLRERVRRLTRHWSDRAGSELPGYDLDIEDDGTLTCEWETDDYRLVWFCLPDGSNRIHQLDRRGPRAKTVVYTPDPTLHQVRRALELMYCQGRG